MVVRPLPFAALMLGLCSGCARAPQPTRIAMYPAYPLAQPAMALSPVPQAASPPAAPQAAPPQASSPQPPPAALPTAGAPAPAVVEAPAPPRHPFHQPLPQLASSQTPASHYANMSPAECRAELKRRDLAVKPRKGAASGVAVPLRITGPIGDVRFVTAPGPTPYGVVDCRMALLLEDFAAVLREHDVTAVRIDNVYRPHAHLPGKRSSSQHAHALALDIMSLTLADGRTLSVEKDWSATIGDTSCGPDANMDPVTENAVALRNIACSVAARGLFHTMLTPSYNAAHRNHFHFDIKRDATRNSMH